MLYEAVRLARRGGMGEGMLWFRRKGCEGKGKAYE